MAELTTTWERELAVPCAKREMALTIIGRYTTILSETTEQVRSVRAPEDWGTLMWIDAILRADNAKRHILGEEPRTQQQITVDPRLLED